MKKNAIIIEIGYYICVILPSANLLSRGVNAIRLPVYPIRIVSYPKIRVRVRCNFTKCKLTK